MHKLTSKRQVTIPQSVCSKLGLEAGDYIQVFERDGVAHLVKMTQSDMAGSLPHRGKSGKLPDASDIKQAIKNKAARKFKGE